MESSVIVALISASIAAVSLIISIYTSVTGARSMKAAQFSNAAEQVKLLEGSIRELLLRSTEVQTTHLPYQSSPGGRGVDDLMALHRPIEEARVYAQEVRTRANSLKRILSAAGDDDRPKIGDSLEKLKAISSILQSSLRTLYDCTVGEYESPWQDPRAHAFESFNGAQGHAPYIRDAFSSKDQQRMLDAAYRFALEGFGCDEIDRYAEEISGGLDSKRPKFILVLWLQFICKRGDKSIDYYNACHHLIEFLAEELGAEIEETAPMVHEAMKSGLGTGGKW